MTEACHSCNCRSFLPGVTEINRLVAVKKEEDTVWYLHGAMVAFHHPEQDVPSFRMYTSQMIVQGTVKPKEIVTAFGVPLVTVKRYVKLYRDEGHKGFYGAKPRRSSATVLTEAVREQAQGVFDAGRSVPEVADDLMVLRNTLHKAIRAGRLHRPQKKRTCHCRTNQDHQERA